MPDTDRPPRPQDDQPRPRDNRAHSPRADRPGALLSTRLAWFALLWLAGVAAVALIGLAIRTVLL